MKQLIALGIVILLVALTCSCTTTATFLETVTSKPPSENVSDSLIPSTVAHTLNSEAITIPTPSPTFAILSSTPPKGQHPYISQGELNYLLYIPRDYKTDAQQMWPMILFLHGAGERGGDIKMVSKIGLPKILESRVNFPFIVASPLLANSYEQNYWSHPTIEKLLFGLLEEIQNTLLIDTTRIYLTGISLGGGGTWDIGLHYPDYFSALVPVAGYSGWPPIVPDNICDLKDEPIWAFHGAKDDVITLDSEQGLVDALKACGGNIKFTVYPDSGHEIWDQAYDTSELYTWMLEQAGK